MRVEVSCPEPAGIDEPGWSLAVIVAAPGVSRRHADTDARAPSRRLGPVLAGVQAALEADPAASARIVVRAAR